MADLDPRSTDADVERLRMLSEVSGMTWDDEDKEEPLCAKQRISFLDLPVELREEIYKLTLANCRSTRFHAPSPKDHLPLFASNKQIYSESLAVLFRKTYIDITIAYHHVNEFEFGDSELRDNPVWGSPWEHLLLFAYHDECEDMLSYGFLNRVPEVELSICDREYGNNSYNLMSMYFPASNGQADSGTKPSIDIRRNETYWSSIMPYGADEDVNPNIYDPYFADMKVAVEADWKRWAEAEGPEMHFSTALFRVLMKRIVYYQTKTYLFQRQQDWWRDYIDDSHLALL